MVRDSKVNPTPGLDSYSLSALQQGMLFHSLEARGAGVDVEQVVCELHEEIHPAQFQRAWREMLARHTILRTSFHWADDEPRQVVHAAGEVRLPFRYEEFGSTDEARRGIEEYLQADRNEGFDMRVAPLIRVALLRGGPEHHWFVLTFHHLLLDGRALAVLFREVLDLHDALVQGERLELPAPRPFRLYIDWLQTLDWSRSETYWRERFRGFTGATALPVQQTSEIADSNRARGELGWRLPAAMAAKLRATARRHDVTLNTIVQAAWAVVLSRYAGEEDVVFGAVRACRRVPVEGAESIVGLFINTAPMRVRVDAQAGIGDWLRGLRKDWIALREHEHTPLPKIQQWSGAGAGSRLFETIVNFQEPSWDAALNRLGGRWAGREFNIRSQPNYPLALDVYGGAVFTLNLLYDRRRVADDVAARMLGHVEVVLTAIADDAVRNVGELPLLTEFERCELREWNNTAADYPRNACVHELFETHAASAPTRLAVADANTSLTYGQLNRRANRLARRLRALGIGPDAPVAVVMERSTEMIVAWLAIAKAGGTLVSLDPQYPRERLAFQLGDCGARAILTQPAWRAALPPLERPAEVIEVRSDWSGLDLESEQNLAPCATARSTAYIIYTSGSTGQPKGVQIEHRSLVNLVTWHQRAYHVTADDRASQLASPAFDAAIWEIWPYLTAGASIHIADAETRVAPTQLIGWLAAKRITLAFLPTPLAEATLDETWPKEVALRAVLTGGDKLKRRPGENFPCVLVNHYGPTENTVVSTCGLVARCSAAALPAIGRPIANMQAHVLDSALRPVPAGVPGELFLSGEGLARGYLNQPELTREKFIVPENSRELPERLYRTGDRVRWLPGGELEFLGRLDGQVKIRGHRIELGEIEVALQRHRSVRAALVTTHADAAGEAELVAHVVKDGGAALSPAELADFLRTALPAPMVPAHFVVLDAWPLTANGKIDRAALPPPISAREVQVGFAAPQGRLEELIAKTWAQLLGRAAVDRHSNFFDLGGHSLLAAQATSRLGRELGLSLSVRMLFDHPVVADLARALERVTETRPVLRPMPRVGAPRQSDPELELVQPN
jgi:amino acid adenylation domain-containing protein